MSINQNFGVAIHILTILALSKDEYVTSKELAESVDTNPAVIRRLLTQLAEKKLIITKQGRFGSKLNPELNDITFYDVYKVFYDDNIVKATHSPSDKCPIGKNINEVLCGMLNEVNANFEADLKKRTINQIKKKMEELLWK